MKSIKSCIGLSLLALAGLLNAGNGVQPKFVSSEDPFGNRVFIENKGQFDEYVKFEDKVHYALITDVEKVFFTANGQ